MFRSNKTARQASINAICHYMVLLRVRSTHDLSLQLVEIIRKINADLAVFTSSDSLLKRMDIFTDAVAEYARITECGIRVPTNIDWDLFNNKADDVLLIQDEKFTGYVSDEKLDLKMSEQLKDLSKITHSYDHLVTARRMLSTTSEKILKIMESKVDYYICDSVIFGAGDTATTLWLEKYKAQHTGTYQALSAKKLPNILMIGENFGSWGHDYTLAQTQSSLERSTAVKNPSDFLPTALYKKNPQANARHVYQANQVCLAETHAPFVRLKMLKIEIREKHDPAQWESSRHRYRCIVLLPDGIIKKIYTSQIDVCTGLGPPNLAIDLSVIPRDELDRLNKFDQTIGFTPFVDGNQFVLTDTEEKKSGRTILIYGGGGTASACYRKCFFGTDIGTYNLEFSEKNQKNKVFWVFKDFIETGKMAENALRAAKKSHTVFKGSLISMAQNHDGKLCLEFSLIDSVSHHAVTRQFVCDQFIYSIGQDDQYTHGICSEVSSNLQLNCDFNGMPLYISTEDKRVSYFGAAAVSFRKAAFNIKTMEWLNLQNIGGDVGAGSMPPTRAQVKRYLSLRDVRPLSINANMDTSDLISEFLLEVGLDKKIIKNFILELIQARKDDTSGCSRAKLEQLLMSYQLDEVLSIYGHSHLILKGAPPTKLSVILSDSFAPERSARLLETVAHDIMPSAEVYFRAHRPDLIRSDYIKTGGFFKAVRVSESDDSFALMSGVEIPLQKDSSLSNVSQEIKYKIKVFAI